MTDTTPPFDYSQLNDDDRRFVQERAESTRWIWQQSADNVPRIAARFRGEPEAAGAAGAPAGDDEGALAG